MKISQNNNQNANVSSGETKGSRVKTPSGFTVSGWKQIAVRVKDELSADNVSLVAGGVGLFALLAAFPALAAIVSMVGIFLSSADLADYLGTVTRLMPTQAREIFQQQLDSLASNQTETLSLGIIIGLLTALWSARKGMVALIQACNLAYDEEEKRGFFKQLWLSVIFTLGAISYFLLVLAIGVILPIVLEFLPLSDNLHDLLGLSRWPLLWLLIVVALAVIYRYAPSRIAPKWRWVTWGSAIAATLWIIGSIGFTLFVSNFGSYDATYGALGGVIVLLLWLYLSGYVVVLGAEINAEMERQTSVDTTIGIDKVIGERGAEVADNTAEPT